MKEEKVLASVTGYLGGVVLWYWGGILKEGLKILSYISHLQVEIVFPPFESRQTL